MPPPPRTCDTKVFWKRDACLRLSSCGARDGGTGPVSTAVGVVVRRARAAWSRLRVHAPRGHQI